MDGRNATGRKISLLNEAGGATQIVAPSKPKISSAPSSLHYPWDATSNSGRRVLAPPEYSRSYPSSTSNSDPPTPLLVRTDSTDSNYLQRTPSPLTPNIGLERLSIMSGSNLPPFISTQSYPDPELVLSAQPYSHSNLYGPQFSPPRRSSYASNPSPPPVRPTIITSHSSAPTSAAASTSSIPQRPAAPTQSSSFRSRRAPVKSSKNTYPCPLGQQYFCDRYFTTSGHAARHAKIHSGEKNIRCPECDKRFARKDNMDQHRKTHRRGAGNTTDVDDDTIMSESGLEPPSAHPSEEKLSAEQKTCAKLRRARKRDMRSPDPHSLRGLSGSEESLDTLPSGGSTSPTTRPRASSNNSLDMLANVALLAEKRPAMYTRETYDSATDNDST